MLVPMVIEKSQFGDAPTISIRVSSRSASSSSAAPSTTTPQISLSPSSSFLEAEDQKKDISLYINSPGGSVTATLAMVDTMNHVKPAVSTVCVGRASGCGDSPLCGREG